MIKTKSDERGFGPLEGILVIVIVAAIGVVGWYVYSHKSSSTTTPVSVSTPSTPAVTNATPISSGTTNSNLQADLSAITASENTSSQDVNASNTALNDKSTFTAVP